MVDDGRVPDDFVRRAGDERDSGAHAFPLRRAFACAGEGIRYAFASQRNLKIHLGRFGARLANLPSGLACRGALHRLGNES